MSGDDESDAEYNLNTKRVRKKFDSPASRIDVGKDGKYHKRKGGALCPSSRASCWRKYNRHMKPRDALRMTALEKWRFYRRVPWKLFLNLFLVIVTSMQVLWTNDVLSEYSRATGDNFEFLLAPENLPDDVKHPVSLAVGDDVVHYIYQAQSLIDSLNYTTYLYFNIENVTVDLYEYVQEDDQAGDAIPPIRMEVVSYSAGSSIFDTDTKFDGDKVKKTYWLTHANDIGPFSQYTGKDLMDYIHTLYSVTVTFKLQNYQVQDDNSVCFEWLTTSDYSFEVRGRLEMTVDSESTFCPSELTKPWHKSSFVFQVYLFALCILFAGISQILTFKSLFFQIKVYMIVSDHNQTKKKKHIYEDDLDVAAGELSDDEEHRPWHTLTFEEKLSFFNVWFIFGTFANSCNIIGSSMGLHEYFTLESVVVTQVTSTVIAAGCLFAWLTMVQYVEGFASYYVLITTLRKSLPRVASFLVGVLPVFLGYALFGVGFFGMESASFKSLDSACVTLFSLLNGDSIMQIFGELDPINGLVSRLYLYSFISLFIYAVLNIFIAIVEDAFFASKAFQLQSAAVFTEASNKPANETLPSSLSFDPSSPRITSSAKTWSKSETEVLSFIDFSPLRGARPALRRQSSRTSRLGINSPDTQPMSPPGAPTRAKSMRDIVTYSDRFDLDGSPDANDDSNKLLRSQSSRAVVQTSSHESKTSPQRDVKPPAQKERSLQEENNAKKVLASINTLHQQAAREFNTQLMTALEQAPLVRPLHAPQFFPCEMDDCLYCVVRKGLEDSLKITKERIREAVNRVARG